VGKNLKYFPDLDDDPGITCCIRSIQVARHDYYSEVLTGSRTIAVFAGHLHPQGGFKRVLFQKFQELLF
jgi:hypothetical protein